MGVDWGYFWQAGGFKTVVFAAAGGGLGVDGGFVGSGWGFIDGGLGVDDETPKRTHLSPDRTPPISVDTLSGT